MSVRLINRWNGAINPDYFGNLSTILSEFQFSPTMQYLPALAFICFDQVFAVPYTIEGDLTEVVNSYALPDATRITTGLAYDPGLGVTDSTLWFGDSNGKLWGLNNEFLPVHQHSAGGDDSEAYISSTPFIYRTTVPDPENLGSAVTKPIVIFGISSPSADFDWNSLFAYVPDKDTQGSLPTGCTQIQALSTSLSNGVIYAGGNSVDYMSTSESNQVFGIRVDELVQGLRDFIIESQLMQDPDKPATDLNNSILHSVARYQTHLTIVDDLKAPRPHEAVKIWADQPNTQVIINDQPYTIGPSDSDYASVKTGVDGTLVIVSTAGNVNTSILRVWAPFMNSFERILIFPDHEFHGRVSNSYASSSTSDASYTDPDHPDLSSVVNYSGTSLFTDDEKTAGQPQQIAKATQQMRQGVDPGGSTQVQLGRVLSALQSADPNTPYVPYEDLTGMHYAPNNAIATRPVQINQATGLKLAVADPSQPYDPNSNPFSHTEINHADARTAIDQLEGLPWSPTDGGLPFEGRRVGNIFTDFWNWLTKVVAEIKQVIVSIAEDVYVGLQYVWNDIKKVFKAIIKVVEDIAHAIASFFVALAKLIKDIIEALSVLFHFGEIMWTQKWLAGQVTTQVSALKTLIQQNVIPNIDSFFGQSTTEIQQVFNQLRSKLNPNQGTKQLPGSGATSHTTFKAGPGSVGPNSSGSSRSVHCSWSLQKMKHGLPGTNLSPSTMQVADSSVSDFINTFIQRLSDGDLSSAFAQLKTDFTNTFSSCSVSTFFDNLLITLLDMIETLVLAAMDVAQAFVDGFMEIINDVIDTVMSAITSEIDIPVLSWLYHEITGEHLTILNLVTLVAAIPVTIIYRVVEGEYPSQGFEKASMTAVQVGINPPLPPFARRVLGVSAGMAAVIAGMINAFADAFGEESPPAPVSYIQTALGMVIAAITGPEVTYTDPSDPPSTDDWIAYGIGIAGLLIGVFGLPVVNLSADDSYMLSFILSLMSVVALAATIYTFINDGSFDPNSDASFAAALIGIFPGMVNPLKLFGEEAALLVAAIDGIAGFAVGAIGMFVTLDTTSIGVIEGLLS
ncbi:hypothetical protein K9N68_39830 (plasmid) [Kovacikia minuta CCNUW1]|uniref:hypothetical protein n=1 Tax=Kovacikia minuta TaxID=2931930 RepID=UPI001CCB9642|nr:hypothetical protein [Kovacikia minuta]UBF30749.1 hypothetical protein K9N68_39830 [Kovacikia minuta CCNUW1]